MASRPGTSWIRFDDNRQEKVSDRSRQSKGAVAATQSLTTGTNSVDDLRKTFNSSHGVSSQGGDSTKLDEINSARAQQQKTDNLLALMLARDGYEDTKAGSQRLDRGPRNGRTKERALETAEMQTQFAAVAQVTQAVK